MNIMILSNGTFEKREIENTLEELQGIVGGYIEIPYLGDAFQRNGIDVIINEEGKLVEGMRPEIAIIDSEQMQILDVVYGNCIFASHDEEGNTVELSEDQELIVLGELVTRIGLTNRNTGETHEVRALFI